ncbi:hypothetical protein IWX90DRAFT_415626 [Phyllosticta citrichinensis]|uniref:Uncharacterized protein n=1 Tax=Phyllosticta citrichinensis TaxID=1130410 RepID=A0ABR1XQH4_9PEZI
MSAKLLLFPALLVLLLATLARTASLADFTPRVTGLTGKCLITYRKSISGCSGDDFQTAANCSARCIAGLADIAAQVARDCNDADVDNDSIIAIFLAGQGPSTLCSNAASATAAPTTSSQNIVRSSTLDLSTTPTAATSIQVDTSVPGTTTTLSISMPTSDTTTSATADSTAGANEPAATTTTTTTSTAPATTGTSSPNSHGGGDPFNLFNAAPTSAALSTWLLTIPMLLCAFWAQFSP